VTAEFVQLHIGCTVCGLVETTVCATVVLVENVTFAKLVRAAETNWPVLAEDDYCGMTATTDQQGTALECR
jgi:hypothetical protein